MSDLLFVFVKENHMNLHQPKPETISEEIVSLFHRTEENFKSGIETLKKITYNEKLKTLASYSYELFERNYVKFALGDVKALTMAVLGKENSIIGLVIAPYDWTISCNRNQALQLGAIVFCCSQAVDFYNGRVENPDLMQIRAAAYEAEYLNAIKGMPNLNLTEYQEKIVERFPNGLPPDLLPPLKPIVSLGEMN